MKINRSSIADKIDLGVVLETEIVGSRGDSDVAQIVRRINKNEPIQIGSVPPSSCSSAYRRCERLHCSKRYFRSKPEREPHANAGSQVAFLLFNNAAL